ncbi:MAG: valine--tRNA ligase, partial [Clostridia bacterium]|nr:valine--tRNA ligase [Clostridia bacterium]
IAAWPKYNEGLEFAKEATDMELIMSALKAVRNQRSEMNIPPSKKAKVYIKTEKPEVFAQATGFFEKLAGASEAIVEGADFVPPANAVSCVVEGAQIFLPLDDLVDKEKELARLEKEKERLLSEIKRVEGKLNNKNFVDKAPAQVVEEEKKKEEKYREMLDKVLESMKLYS